MLGFCEIGFAWLRPENLHSVVLVGVGPDQVAGTYWYRSGIHGIGQTNALIAGIEGLRFRMVAAGYCGRALKQA